MDSIEISLAYEGEDADQNRIDFYDVSRALLGFQRSLALTAHLVINNQIITQSPSLKGAQIVVYPPAPGSWKITALVMTAIWTAGTAPRDTPIGNLIASAYDYVIDETLGFHVDYDQTLGEQYEEYRRQHPEAKDMNQGRFDSLAEKCVPAIIDMHRPIVFSQTATFAGLIVDNGSYQRALGQQLNVQTYEYIGYNDESTSTQQICGNVTSYNSNAFAGRIYVPDEMRSISFILTEGARTRPAIDSVTRSLFNTARQMTNYTDESKVCFIAYSTKSKTGKLKKITVIRVQ